MGVEGDRVADVNDVVGVHFAFPKVALGRAFLDDPGALTEDDLLPVFQDFIGSGVVRVGVFHFVLREVVVLHVVVWQSRRVQSVAVSNLLESCDPAGFGFLVEVSAHVVAVLLDIFFQKRH